MKLIPAGAAALLLLLASMPGARAEAPIRARYLCKGRFDATELTALFFNDAPSSVVLLTGSEGATRLMQQRSASGARYSDGTETFWIKGDQASWQHGKAAAMQCNVSSGSPGPTR